MAEIEIYTDGSSSLKSGYCGWAVYAKIGEREFKRCGYEMGTNQRAELQAIVQALKLIPEGASAKIVSDSEYGIKAMTTYRRKWSMNGYKNIDGNPISHRELITEGYRYLDRRHIVFQHVRGHQGTPGNEAADKLAKAARFVGEGKTDGSDIGEFLIMKGG